MILSAVKNKERLNYCISRTVKLANDTLLDEDWEDLEERLKEREEELARLRKESEEFAARLRSESEQAAAQASKRRK